MIIIMTAQYYEQRIATTQSTCPSNLWRERDSNTSSKSTGQKITKGIKKGQQI